ncbi:DUF6531 domain-containing protein [Cellulomonas sp. ACRRI]|nr:DUF6531 domain-containing protein [Cellulomonas sp. ACRRI]
MPEGGPRVYRAVVASPRGPNVDVQAVSNTFVGPTLGGPNQRCETSGGANPSQQVTQRCHGDPVNSATGELFENSVDLSIEGDLLAPAWTRSYGTSRAETDLGLGHGWTFGYSMSLVPDEGDDLADAPWIEVHQENGSTIVFARDEAGGFVTAARVLATLVRNADGTYRLRRHGGDGFVFDASGRLLRIEDRNGNTVGLTRDAEGRLVSAADQRGRSLTVRWSDGRIVGISDSAGRSVSYAYSPDGDLTEVTMPDGSTRGYEYDTQHRIVALIDALGGEHRNIYDSQSRVAQQTDPLGNVTTFGYTTGKTTITGPDRSVTVEEYSDGQLVAETIGYGTSRAATTRYVYGPTNHVAAVTDPVGRITQYTHDAHGNVLTEVDPLGRVTRSTYDDHDNLLTRTDATGATWAYGYDAAGNLVSETDPLGAVTAHVRNADGTVASTTDPLGHTTTFGYDARGNVVTITEADGATVTRTVDPTGQTVSETDARGGTTTYTRDGLGRVTSVTEPDGGTTSFDLDAAGNVLREVGPDGAEHRTEYDALGRPTATTDPTGAVTLLEHDPAGRLVAETDPEGDTTRWAYDPDGALMAVTDGLNRTVRYTRDRAGRMTGETLPSGALTVHGYDAAGQHVSTRDPLGGTTSIDYDRAGRPETVVDADGRTTTTGRDAAGQTLSVTRSDGTSVTYAYDLAGRLTSYTDADGRATTYAYDAVGQVTALTDDAGRTTTFGYDAVGNVVTVTAPDGTVTTHGYDAAGRVVEVDYGGQDRTAFTYDAAGRRSSMTDTTGTTRYAYDGAGRTLEVAGPQGTVRYGWTSRDDLATLTHSDGSVVAREYDAARQLVAVTDWDGGRYDLTWDDDGRLATVTYPNGVTERQTYDSAGRTKRATTTSGGTALLDLAWTYSPAGLLSSETSARADGVTRSSTYEWDAQARLSTVSGSTAGEVGFDAADRVTLLTDGTRLDYDPAGQVAIATLDGVETRFEHDGRGNRTRETSPGRDLVLTFDAANRLAAVGDADTSWTHTYDGDGLLASTTKVAATVAEAVQPTTEPQDQSAPLPTAETDDAAGPDDATAEHEEDPAAPPTEPGVEDGPEPDPDSGTAVDNPGEPEGEVDDPRDAEPVTPSAAEPEETRAATARTQHFAWDASGAIPLLIGDGERSFLYLSGTTPAAQREADGTVRYLHTDGIGSVRMVTDEAGAVVAGTDYQPYGQALSTGLAPVSDISEFGYAGERTDSSGLLYLRARWYDTATASFLSVDPLVELTRTAYGYTRGNPLQFTDPLGLLSADTWDKIAFGLGVLAIVSGPAAPAVAAAAVGVAAVATATRIRNGDPAIDIILSGAGIIPGVGSAVGRSAAGMIRAASRATGNLTRMTASQVRRGTQYVEAIDRWIISPAANYGSAWRAAWCARLI